MIHALSILGESFIGTVLVLLLPAVIILVAEIHERVHNDDEVSKSIRTLVNDHLLDSTLRKHGMK